MGGGGVLVDVWVRATVVLVARGTASRSGDNCGVEGDSNNVAGGVGRAWDNPVAEPSKRRSSL